jgi:hypothetical protein
VHTLLEPRIKAGPGERGFVVARVVARGIKGDKTCEVLGELIDHYDPKAGFTAMERDAERPEAALHDRGRALVVALRSHVPEPRSLLTA